MDPDLAERISAAHLENFERQFVGGSGVSAQPDWAFSTGGSGEFHLRERMDAARCNVCPGNLLGGCGEFPLQARASTSGEAGHGVCPGNLLGGSGAVYQQDQALHGAGWW